MSSLKALYRSSSHYLAGNVGVMVLGFISFPIFTRTLSVEQYGELNYALRIILLTVILAKSGLAHSMVRFFSDDATSSDPREVDKYYSTFFFAGILAAGVVSVVYLIVVSAIPSSMVSGSLRFLLMLGAAFVFANALTSLFTGTLRAAGRSKDFASVQLLIKALSIATTCALLFLWQRTARAMLISNVLSETATLCVLVAWYVRDHPVARRMFDAEYANKIISFGLPLIAFEISAAVLDSGDRILIKMFLGENAVGYYSAAYNVSSYLQDLVFASLNLALIPIYLKIWKESGQEATEAFLSSSLNDFVLACCLLCCGAAVCAGDALVMLSGEKYRASGPLVPWLVVGLMMYTLAAFLNAGLYLHKRTRTMAGIVAASAVVNIVLNVLLLPRFGIIAAVWATIVSFAFLLIVTGIMSSRHLKIQVDVPNAVGAVATAVVVASLVSHINLDKAVLNVLVKGALSVAAYVAVILLINRRARERVLGMVRSRA